MLLQKFLLSIFASILRIVFRDDAEPLSWLLGPGFSARLKTVPCTGSRVPVNALRHPARTNKAHAPIA
jgi:hypothetical protein